MHGLPARGRLLVATVGSGSDGYPVLDGVLAALEHLREDLYAVLVTGPYMPADQRANLQARATASWRVVPQADNLELMAAADVVGGMGSYNSVYEAPRGARPLVLGSRAAHTVEQRI